MVNKFKTNRTIIEILEYVLIILLVLSCNTPYSKSISIDYRIVELLLTTGVILFLFILLDKKIDIYIITNFFTVFSVYFILVFVYFFLKVKSNFMINYISRYILIVPLFSLIIAYKNKYTGIYDLIKKYNNVVLVIAIISLFFWYFASILKIISPTGYVMVNWGGIHTYLGYYGLYFERQVGGNLSGNVIFRNCGLFCEAPMFSLCLTIALAAEVFIIKNIERSKRIVMVFNEKPIFKTSSRKYRIIPIIILVITLLTTVSTTGILLMILIFIIRYCIENPKGKVTRFIKIAVGFIIIIVGFYVGYEIYTNKASSNSWKTHLDDFKAGYLAWKNDVIFGNGYNNMYMIQLYMNKKLRGNNLGYSNSIFLILAQGGLLLFSVYVIPFISYTIKGIKENDINLLAFTFIIILEFILVLWQDTFLIMFFLAFGYSFLIVQGKFNVSLKNDL